jgi:hypothetical protein
MFSGISSTVRVEVLALGSSLAISQRYIEGLAK